MNTTDADDELRLLHDAVWGTLGAPTADDPPAPDADWRTSWPKLAGLGVVALCAPEAAGGFGFRVDAAVATSRALGAVLHGAPYAATVVAAHVLASAAGSAPDAAPVEGLLDGSRLAAVGSLDPSGRVARVVDGAGDADVLVLVPNEADAGAGADEVVLLTDRASWSVVGAHTFDVTRSIVDVEVDRAAATTIGVPPTMAGLHGLLLAADALGGVQRMLDRTVAYAAQRQAFGRAIGGFQAVQHRLVDHALRTRGMALLVADAARRLGAGDRGAARAVALAELSVSAGALHVLHDLLQLTGAIGFTWEHGLHLYERRVHQDARLRANPRTAIATIASIDGWTTPAAPAPEATATGLGGGTEDDTDDDREDDTDVEAFRREVRAFIAEHGHPMVGEGVRVPRDAEEERAIRHWLAALHNAGYLGGGWPEAHGGRAGHRAVHDLVLMEELIRGDVYRPLDQVMLAAHAVIAFGTDAQHAELLPRIRRGEHVWCQLFSEPDAGSDLAALRTRAERDGDDFVVTGQKIWCTDGQWADMGMLLARTDPAVDRHAGLTAFVVPMDLPGIEVRPIREMTGHDEFCEVFLDGVRLGPEHVLGEVDDGWRVITSGLASERAFVGANAVQLERMFGDLVALARTARLRDGTAAIEHEDVRAQLAGARVRVEEVGRIVRDAVDRILADDEHPADGPVTKLAYTEANVALCELALELIASSASIEPDGVEVAARWEHNFLWSRALTVSGGASEIMRGLIGRQLLGLPRA